MPESRWFRWTLLFPLAFALVHADDAADLLKCGRSATALRERSAAPIRQYAPDRRADFLHLALDVTPDFTRRTIQATATLKFKPIAQPLDELRLDATRLRVASVQSTSAIEAWNATDEDIRITFSPAVAPDREVEVSIRYDAEPEEGLYFRTPELGYLPGDTHLFSQGEAVLARQWYPSFDAPNEKFTSEVTCHVPEGMVVLSNGHKVSEAKDPATGLVAFRWRQDKPHVNYLITLVAGFFQRLEDRHQQVPLAFYTPPSEFREAATSFAETRDMMAFFEQETGVAYPWDRYDQVVVQDFVAGGMENTTQTTLTDHTLFTPEFENLRTSRGLVAHELSHQWFGDLVTCKDWGHLWLNEGFATYYETLYEGFRNGRDAMLYELYGRARHLTGLANDTQPIVRRVFASPDDMFDHLSYGKGSWVLHMLRSQLGESLYRECVRTFLERYRFGNAVSADLLSVIEEKSGLSYDRFFDQWLYHAHHPELDVRYDWDQKNRLAKLHLRQVQALSPTVLLFEVPLTVRFKTAQATVDRTLRVTRAEEDFYVPLDSAPTVVRIDPNYGLLAKINFAPPSAMIPLLLKDETDVIGRLLAVEELAKRNDRDAVGQLKGVLQSDGFFGVRVEAARALAGLHSESARDALLACQDQPDARVRNEVVAALGRFYADSTLSAAQALLAKERNPDIQAQAIRALGGYAAPEVKDTLLCYLRSSSYRQVLAHAAIDAIRLQDDPAYGPAVREVLSTNEPAFPTGIFAAGLELAGYLARNEDDRGATREFLLRFVDHRRPAIAAAALRALGTLGDPKAIGAVQKFASARKGSPLQVAAEHSLATLRAGRKPVDDFKNLREEVTELQKANRELREGQEELRKRLDALATKPSPGKSAKPKKNEPGRQ